MGYKDQCGPELLIQCFEEFHDSRARVPVQIPCGLVGKEDLGPRDKGSGKGDSLLLPTRKLRRIMAQSSRKAHLIEKRTGLIPDLAGREIGTHGRQLKRDLNVFQRSQAWQEMKRLEDKPHMRRTKPCPAIFGKRSEIGVTEAHRTPARGVESSHDPQQGRFA